MHTPSPPTQEPAIVPCSSLAPSFRRKRAGFSLIEVTLAIAIVAFAFVALIGLLPAGLGVFNQTMDSSNELRVTNDLTSLLQATEFEDLGKANIVGNIYYFDVDGGLLDTQLAPNANYENERIYAAKIVIAPQNVDNFVYAVERTKKALVVIGKNTPAAIKALEAISSPSDVAQAKRELKFRVVPLVITKTDGVK